MTDLQSVIEAILASLLSKRRIKSPVTVILSTGEGPKLVVSVTGADLQASDSKTRGALDEQKLSRIVAVIHEKIEEPLSVSMLSSVAGLSRSRFSQAFRAAVGRSPHAHIVQLRVERAMKLMLETDSSLSEIALATGFTDQAHFSNRFRRAVGTTPAQWRKSHREK